MQSPLSMRPTRVHGGSALPLRDIHHEATKNTKKHEDLSTRREALASVLRVPLCSL
jgi:hypothetical protein